MIDKPGIYTMPIEEYHSNPAPKPCFSTGVCKDLLFATPFHAWTNHPALNPCFKEEPNEKFDIGAAAHPLLLEGVDVVCVIDAEDWRKKETREQREEARANGKVPLLKTQADSILAMIANAYDAIFDTLGIAGLRQHGSSEQSYFWTEGDTWLKVRPDWRASGDMLILHYKTTAQLANPEGLHRIILSLGYDIAESLYRRGHYALTGKRPRSLFLFQETSPPYQCSFVELSPQWQAVGDEKVDRGLAIWNRCIQRNEWPGYSTKVYTLDLPPWAIAAWEEKRFGLELQEPQEEGL